MSDPFAGLRNALQPIFRLAPPSRNGTYTFAEINELAEALIDYQNNPELKTFRNLVRKIRSVLELPFFKDKQQIDFHAIGSFITAIAKELNVSASSTPTAKTSPRFQFSTHHPQQINTEAISSLVKQAAGSANTLIKLLLDKKEHPGFSQILNEYLRQDGNSHFLFDLVMASPQNFIDIAGTTLILHLDDEQLAHAIIKHQDYFVKPKEESLEEALLLVERINGVLSTGRSISTLLRSAQAKSILCEEELFSLYLAELDSPASDEEAGYKPI